MAKKNILSLYPRINKNILQKIGCTLSDYKFYYQKNGFNYLLDCDEFEEGLYEINDTNGLWNADEFPLTIYQKISIDNPTLLFGQGGVACSNSQLTVAIVWTSSDSRQRGLIQLGNIEKKDNHCDLAGEFTFDRGSLRGNITFQTRLFINKPGTLYQGEEIFANQSGMALGDFNDVKDIVIDGNASVFPIYEVDMPGEPLWEVRCDWTDPVYDKFNESFSIFLNRAHPSYCFINQSDKLHFNQELLNEIMASSLTQLILKLKENDELDMCLLSAKNVKGSVAEAVDYFISALEFDISDNINLSRSIRKFFDERMR